MLLGIFSLLLSKVSFSLIVVSWKNLRKRGVSTLSNLSIFVFSIPVLLLMGGLASTHYEIFLSPYYFLLVFLWVIPVFFSNFLDVYLLRYQALTEQSSYKLAITTVLALVTDLYIFHTEYNLWTIIAVILFFVGGSIITRNKVTRIDHLSIATVFFLMILIAGLDIVDYALYKQGLLIQSTIFFHILVTQSILFLMFFIVGFKKFIPDLKLKKISAVDIVRINTLIVIYLVAAATALKTLPLILVVSASILPLVLYSVFDFRNKELTFTYKSVLALLLVSVGVFILGWF